MANPIYFGVVFWGKEFRGFFTDFCLPSLLSPHNIPSLEKRSGNAFLICTTCEDWAQIQKHPIFHVLKKYIEPVFLEIQQPEPGESKMHVMSQGHKAIASKMFEQNVYGSFIYPDTIFGDGVVAECQRLIKEEKKVVLAHCPRFANEGLLNELMKLGLVKPGIPIALPGAKLIELGIPHMHSEMRRNEWEAPYFYAEAPSLVWWKVDEGSLLVHTQTWAPLVVDYGALKKHDTQTLDEWTIDGDYIFRNFGQSEEIYAETNSEVMTLMSFTPESQLTFFPLKRGNLVGLPVLGEWYRRLCLRAYFSSPTIDQLKRKLFHSPIFMGRRPDEKNVLQVQSEAKRILSKCLVPPNNMQLRALYWLRILNEGILLHIGFWIARRPSVIKWIPGFLKKLLLGKSVAWK